ncbi:MAG: hypothetical protein ACHQF2_05220 [Flavobacteriales bacterium]
MKWKTLTYRQKNYPLWAATLVFVVFIYKKNISATLNLISSCAELENKLVQAENADVKLAILRSQLKKINEGSGNMNISSEQIEQEILDRAAKLSQKENIMLSSFKEAHQVVTNGYMVTSHMIEIEGGFVPAVRFIHAFEKEFKDARLVSIKFYTKEDYKTHKKYLYGTLCFQHVRKA